jgi:hypothetical protein
VIGKAAKNPAALSVRLVRAGGFQAQRATHSVYALQDSGSNYLLEVFAFFPEEPTRMYSAVPKRDDVFSLTIRVHAISNQGERNKPFAQEFIEDLLSCCGPLFYHDETSESGKTCITWRLDRGIPKLHR